MIEQCFFDSADCLRHVVERHSIKRLFIVHGKSYSRLPIAGIAGSLPVAMTEYSGFSANPRYDDVCTAVEAYKRACCDAILAVGGGSAMDVAKCVKLFAVMEKEDYLLPGRYRDSGIPLVAMPSTAGSGSESTHFAVIHKDGEKRSIAHAGIRPDYVVLIPDMLDSLPPYLKKCSFLDALCQSIEAWWSINSTEESIAYSRESIKLLLESYEGYFRGGRDTNRNMLLGANYSGRAINIAKTTAPHALSYKLTSTLGLPHGHAVAVCLPAVWESMLDNPDKLRDHRGARHVADVFSDISHSMGYSDPREAVSGFRDLLLRLGMIAPSGIPEKTVVELAAGVNRERLENSPVMFDAEMIRRVYGNALSGE